MKDLEAKLHQQFPESKDKQIEFYGAGVEIYDPVAYDDEFERLMSEDRYSEAEELKETKGTKTHKLPKGYLAVTTTDKTLYLVKV